MVQNSYDYATRKGIRPISWEDFHGICKALALSVSHFQPEVILPIGRGGYYPGTLLAHLLQIEIYPVRISRRINDVVKYNEPQWIITPPAEIVHRRVLVVDEICDSGETILIVKEKCLALGAALAKSAVLYAHTKAVGVPDYIGIITDELLLNPWDREVFRNGGFHFNPEYAEALVHQGLEANPEMLIPAKFFGCQKNKAVQHSPASRDLRRATDPSTGLGQASGTRHVLDIFVPWSRFLQTSVVPPTCGYPTREEHPRGQ